MTGVCELAKVPALHLHESVRAGFEEEALPSPIASLKLKKETTGQVYFFETDALDLLSEGVIVSVRQGADNDLTVKVRPPTAKKFCDPFREHEDFKYEIELNGGEVTPSYSIRKKYAALQAPGAGHDIFRLLRNGQKETDKGNSGVD
jgi:hypothetical protein